MANKKINGDLILEVTQRCNMDCDHCLRGKCRNVNITHEIIDATLDQFGYIGMLTFTGGEPTLNVEAIEYTVEQIKKRGISIGGFYVVTNAQKFSARLVTALLQLYVISDEREMCGLTVSVDEFHDDYDETAYDIYSCLPFFRTDKEHRNYDLGEYLINRGNAEEYGIGTRDMDVTMFSPEYAEVYNDEISFTEYIYINAKGYVFFDCDLSYKMQDELQTINVLTDDISEWMESQMKELIPA